MWIGDNDTEERWRARLESDGACFIAYADGVPVGMVAGRPSDDGGAELISIWVAPEVRRQGLGQALVSTIVVWAAGRSLSLRVVDGNVAATELYEAEGFVMEPAYADTEGCRRMWLSDIPKEQA